MTHSFRLAHLSDLHFSDVEFNFRQFLSKRWIGNFNYLLRRKKDFNYPQLDLLPSFLQELQVKFVLLSGDLSCTSSESEFRKGAEFIKKLESAGLEVITIPGNHDHYIKKAYQEKLFYKFFPPKNFSGKWNLQEHQVTLKHLQDKWWLILLDTALATPLLCSHGRFSKEIEKNLHEVLSSLPEDAHVLLANHFPLDCEKWRPSLQRRKALWSLLKAHPNIRFYLHGHDHNHRIADLRKRHLPISIDAGSVSHGESGTWSLMNCKEKSCSFQPFHWNMKKNAWIPGNQSSSFNW